MDARLTRRWQGNDGERRRTRCALVGVLLAGAGLVGANRMQDTVLDMTQVAALTTPRARHAGAHPPKPKPCKQLLAALGLGAHGEVVGCRPRR